MIEVLQKIEKLKIEEFLPNLDDFYKIRELMMSVCSALVSRGCDLTRSSKTEDTALNYFAFFGFCELIEECPEILFEVKLRILSLLTFFRDLLASGFIFTFFRNVTNRVGIACISPLKLANLMRSNLF